MAELYSSDFLHGSSDVGLGGTNGRVPSLFNGHLLDYLPVLLILFGPIAYLDLQSKGFGLQVHAIFLDLLPYQYISHLF